MQVDFLDAHERHWTDAELLFEARRWANADHLYGMAAECGLKRLMLAFGMPLNHAKDRPDKASDRQHADGIWARYESYRCGHHWGAGYVLPSENPFKNWEVSQRYANRSHFDQARVQEHQSGAHAVRTLVTKARKEGLL
ncbi:MAG: SAM-dependent methyltransferase [Rhodocyclaceae bacterium]|nr:SAM-dependent methyltransferase [Rhodocyclaceae bacterium]